MDAGDWLKTIEKKFQVVQCNNRKMVLFTSHTLEGLAHEEHHNINWQEFRTAFHLHHIPQGIIKMKKKEFQDLKQGSISVSEYLLSSPSCPITPLVTWIRMKRNKIVFSMDLMMVNKALVLENCRGAMERKRLRICSSSVGHVFRPIQQQPQQRPQFQPRPPLVDQGFQSHQRQFTPRKINFKSTNPRNQTMSRSPTTQTTSQNPIDRRCFNCGENGHFEDACPKPRARSI
jgi:hypothetical protein